jgi:hypothetical protein
MAAVFFSAFANFAWAKGELGSLDLNLRQNRYLGETQTLEQNTNDTFFAGGLNLTPETQTMKFKLNSLAQGTFEDKNEFYFGVPELYVEPKNLAADIGVTVGRQKRHWSRLDEEFNLGVWQPQLRWDYLQPQQEGLIGVFFDWRVSSSVRLTFLTSPLSIPDQGPNFQLRRGQFISANRWFVPPQSRLSLFQGTDYAKDGPLYFELERPSEEQLVMHSTLGAGLHLQGSGPWWMDVNYAYKPRNQIHLGVECSLCGQLPSLSGAPVEVTAVVHPRVVMHNVLTVESGFERMDDRGWLSLTADKPSASGFPADFEEAPLDSMLIAGAAYQHYLSPGDFWPPSWLKLAYMQLFTLDETDRHGLVDSDQVQSSLDRYPYRQLAALEWKILVRQRRLSRLEINTRYSYSIPERGSWLAASIDFMQDRFIYGFGVDVLGAEVDADSRDAGLFSRYRSNDRVYGGVSYVF